MRNAFGLGRQLPCLSNVRVLKPACLFSTSPAAALELVEMFVDGRPVRLPAGSTIIQACTKAGIDIPRFCYHERLAIAGNCRMCLVQVDKAPKLVASCAQPVAAGMRVVTTSEAVKRGREGVMEFLLANHPLDCPVCDQGGECDLQDQAMAFGSDRSRFATLGLPKRAVADKNFGPLVKTSMNRCIHCTRCVRFANEVAGLEELGTSGRGNEMEIGTYIEKMLDSELSGNIVDLCPVGALTAKPYEFTARPWELRRTESIDVMDALGSAIRVDSRGLEVMRILPRLNEEVNEEWLADKSRFSYDGLRRQRLVQPLIRNAPNGGFAPATWEYALSVVADRLVRTASDRVEAVAGQFADVESMVALKDLLAAHGSQNMRFDGNSMTSAFLNPTDSELPFAFNSGIAEIEHADAILLVGTNLRHEAPLLNARIRKNYLRSDVSIGLIGEPVSLTYEYAHLGVSANDLRALLDDHHPFFAKLKRAKRPALILGHATIFDHPEGEVTLQLFTKLASKLPALLQEEWNGINFLPPSASRVGALDLGWRAQKPRTAQPAPTFIYLLNADHIPEGAIPADAFVVYQGHHGDVGAQLANVILPAAAYTEKDAIYVNLERRSQSTLRAVPPPGDAREDWKVIRALSELAGMSLPYHTIEAVRNRAEKMAPGITELDRRRQVDVNVARRGLARLLGRTAQPAHSFAGTLPYVLPIKDYYLTDCISRSSPTMAKCSQTFARRHTASSVGDGQPSNQGRHAK